MSNLAFLFPETERRWVLVNSVSRGWTGREWVDTVRWNGAGWVNVSDDLRRMTLENARKTARLLQRQGAGRPFVVECPPGAAVPDNLVAADRFQLSQSEEEAETARAVGSLFPPGSERSSAKPRTPAPPPLPSKSRRSTATTRAVNPEWAVMTEEPRRFLAASGSLVRNSAGARIFPTRSDAEGALKRLALPGRVVNLAL